MWPRAMRALVGVIAVACLVLAACTTPANLTSHPGSTTQDAQASSCPDGKQVQPGLTAFGAYIGTWQANHQRLPQTPNYAFAMTSGWVSVQCSATDYVVVEAINLKFSVPSGRALQFALTDLPADSKQVFDHAHEACRSLQYASPQLARQLPKDDAGGLADITVRTPNANGDSLLQVVISVGTALGDDSRACQ